MLPVQASNSKIAALIERSKLLQQVRSFFFQKGYIEVDTPLLSKRSPIDLNIDILQVPLAAGEKGFLISSPEYAIKRLLSYGLPNAFQLSHVFRAYESSSKHNPEFTMIEWYCKSSPEQTAQESFECIIEQTLSLIESAIGKKGRLFHSYWDIFSSLIGLELKQALALGEEPCKSALLQWLAKHDPYHPLKPSDSLDGCLSYLMSYHVEPKLASDTLHVIYEFPSSQADLATTFDKQGLVVARRFEVYYGSLELANGYHELANSKELRMRLEQQQQARIGVGKDPLLLDERLVDSIDRLPPCCGVALGFDRLLMCQLKASRISDVIPFDWDHA